MVEKHYTPEEQEQYDAVVEDIAIKGASKEGTDTERLIVDVLNENSMHEDLKLRLRRDVERKIAELKQKAKTDQEAKVVDKFDGYVTTVNGKYVPTGVDEKFNVRVKPGESWSMSDLKAHGYEGKYGALYAKGLWWKMGGIFERTFGRTVNSKEFNEIIKEAEEASEEVAKLTRDLELLRATQKSIKDLMAMSAAGFVTRIRSRGVGSVIGSSIDSAGDFVEGVFDKYGDDRKNLKRVSITIAEKVKIMKEKEAIRDAALKKMEELRGSGQDLFDKAFKPQVDVILSQKDQMTETEYNKKVKKLRKDVEEWGQKTGFVHMSVFLNEALGIKEEGEEVVSDVELKTRRAAVSRFVADCTGKAPSGTDVQGLISGLEAKQPEMLKSIYEKKVPPAVLMTLQILYKGEFKDIKLNEARRSTYSTDGFMKNLVYAHEYAKSGEAKVKQVFEKFAEDWQGVNADEFDDVFNLILDGREPTEKERYAEGAESADDLKFKFIKNLWREATDENATDKTVNEIYKALQKDPDFKNKYHRIFNEPTRRKLLGVMFRGVYNKNQWVIARKKYLDLTADNFVQALHLVDDWINDVTANEKEIRYVVKTFGQDEEFRNMDFSNLSKEVFRRILEDGRKNHRKEVEKGGVKPRKEDEVPPLSLAA